MNAEVLAFVLYFVLMLAIGVLFFFKEKGAGEKEYFLGGRHMGPWVTAMSAQASDMSAWLLMGLPGSILAFGFGQIWIGIGLALVDSIMTALDGTLDIKSTLGRGTVVTLGLPLYHKA